MPIGETLDREDLSEACTQLERYSFFMSSVQLKVSWDTEDAFYASN
jgi:hypothetical protein